ncbi:MAG TPA: hypothetical protein VKB76_15495, partial [Ktedonobacterales bacterium]|nr:hypothetical protein [Ktedonobacterales bacterium]
RLYATITRLKIDATSPLVRFQEDEPLKLEGLINRLGAGLFFSDFVLTCPRRTIRASLMSSFTKRGSPASNRSLLKGQPNIPPGCPIPDLATMPQLGQGYRDRRRRVLAPAIFEVPYDIIPHHDINGAGLLYFAAYPIINDICEMKYMGCGNRWAIEASTISRDIFYFANSDVEDGLYYRVHARRDLPGAIEIESSISRKSDDAVMAHLVTRKALASA